MLALGPTDLVLSCAGCHSSCEFRAAAVTLYLEAPMSQSSFPTSCPSIILSTSFSAKFPELWGGGGVQTGTLLRSEYTQALHSSSWARDESLLH